ncbi:hypothetical protein I543_3799 [Mycobacteroides abscessus 21]|uniref:Uncharacterized protein n=1 Tax=Mycobacteroides abscessus 21 TaxID=1299324 RepID=A0A829PXC1_9MYCO|nr:hypothetical protein I543_3799 [Mycobacteroides abscessus 21]
MARLLLGARAVMVKTVDRFGRNRSSRNTPPTHPYRLKVNPYW